MKSTPLKKYLIFGLFLVVILGLTIGTHYLLGPVRKNTQEKFDSAKYAEVLGGKAPTKVENVAIKDTDPKTILSIKEAFDGTKSIAKIYEVKGENVYGSIEILISVEATNNVLGVTSTVVQTMKVPEIIKYIESHVGKKIDKPSIDAGSKPTVSFSTDLVDNLIKDVAKAHGVVEEVKSIYEILFGKDHTFSEVSKIEVENLSVTAKKDVLVNELVVANVYYIEKVGLKINDGEYDGPADASIELQVIVDPFTTQILGVDFDMTKYEHSLGSYKTNVDNYLKKLIDNETLAVNYTKDIIEIDGESGATSSGTPNSVVLIMDMLVDLATYLTDELKYEVKDLEVITDEFVVSKREITIDTETFTIYETKGTGKYIDGENDEGSIITSLIIDKDGIIIATKFTSYGHTSAAYFKSNSDKFINSLVTNKVNINDFKLDHAVDEESGASSGTSASNSVAVIIESIFGLTTYIKGGK